MKSKSFIPVAAPDLTGNEKKYINRCLESSWISSKGEFIDRFEKEFAQYIGTKYAVSTCNGTCALHLAIYALDIGSGDEVIVPDLTFIASANAVRYTGAKPIFADVDEKTWNIDPEKIVQKISSATRAIMPVHLYGHPAHMNKIMDIAQNHDLMIIEDAAEAHGAEVRIQELKNGGIEEWKKVGSMGKVGCFSFYGNKILTTGEGGMVTTNDGALAEKMRILRDHGQKPGRRYYHEFVGFNYRMTNLQASVGVAQLERIDELITKKREIAGLYNKYLKNIPGITIPPLEEWAEDVYWMYSVLINKPFPKTRDQMIDILKKENIESRPFFYPIHTLPPYILRDKFAASEIISSAGINLPSGVNLRKEDIMRIIGIFKKIGRLNL